MAASKAKDKRPGIRVISKNRAARHNYAIDETFEAGIELTGAEVKSLRDRAAQLTDTFVLIRGGEVWLNGMHIHPYVNGGVWNPRSGPPAQAAAAPQADRLHGAEAPHEGRRDRAAADVL